MKFSPNWLTQLDMVWAKVDSNNTVSLDPASTEGLSKRELADAQATVDLVNRLASDLGSIKGDFPKPGQQTAKISSQVQSQIKSGIDALTRGKSNPDEAITLFSKALETALRRPLWENMQLSLSDVCLCLGPRCDAYIASGRWADAYADACMLMVLNAGDPKAYYRKGLCLLNAHKKAEARILLEQAVSLAPQEKLFKQALDQLDGDLKTDEIPQLYDVALLSTKN